MNRIRVIRMFIAMLLFLSMVSPALADVLTIPKGVTVIQDEAFFGDTSLDEVVLPDGVTEIGEKAFSESSVTKINLPDSITAIADNAFDAGAEIEMTATEGTFGYDWAVEKGYIVSGQGNESSPEDFTYTVFSGGAIWISGYKGNDTAIVTPSKDPSGNPVVGIWSLSSDTLKEITVSKGVKSIGWQAFSECPKLEKITLPEGLTEISDSAFRNCKKLKSVIIPDSVTELGMSAFAECVQLSSVELSSGISLIPDYAFLNCSNLGTVVIPENVETIGMMAFSGCTNLSRVTFSDGLKEIKGNAFEGCTKINELKLNENLLIIGPDAFRGCSALTKVILPSSLSAIEQEAFFLCESLETIQFTSLTGSLTIGNAAFHLCTALQELNIPDGVTSIGEQCFEECTSLAEVHIPESVHIIGDRAFSECSNLNDVEIEADSGTSIGKNAFSNCTSLKTIVLPEGVTSIGDSPFDGCDHLVSIRLPESLASTDNYFLRYLPALQVIFAKRDSYAWKKVSSEGLGTLLQDITTGHLATTGVSDFEYQECYYVQYCSYAAVTRYLGNEPYVVIPQRFEGYVTAEIGANAFADCTHVVSVILPRYVETIGASAFANCSNLEEIVLPQKIGEIDETAFDNCSKLKRVYAEKGSYSWQWMQSHGYGSALIDNEYEDFIFVSYDGNTSILENYTGTNEVVIIPSEDQEGRTVTGISLGAFHGDSYIREVSIPGTVQTVSQSFFDCINLLRIFVPASVTSIGDYTFLGCENLEEIYAVKDTYAWTWFEENGFKEKLVDWDGSSSPGNSAPTISGTVVIGNMPVESAYVYAFDANDEIRGMAVTDRNGCWSMRLKKGESYSLVYGLSGYKLASGTTSVTLTADTDAGTAVLEPDGVSDSSVSFTMTYDNLKVGTTIHFNISCTISNEVRLIVNDVPYEYIALENGARAYDRIFHLKGTRNIRFSAVDSDGVTYLSSIQTITLTSDGDLNEPQVAAVGDQCVGKGFTLTWVGDDRAAGYMVYLYGPQGLAWPASKYYFTEENITPNTYISVPGNKLLLDGDYTIDVVAFGNGLNQATGSAAFTVYETDTEATITYPYNGAKYVVGDTMHTTIAGGKGTKDLCLGVSYNGGADVMCDITENGKFEPKAEKVGKYKLTPYTKSNDGTWTVVADEAITVNVRAPQITDLKQGSHKFYSYKGQRSSFSFSGTIDDNTSILISGAESDTIPAKSGTTKFTWTSSVINDVGIYNFIFTPVRNGVEGEPKTFPVVIMEDVTDTTKNTKNVLDVWSIPNGYVKDTLGRGTQVTETYICDDYSLIEWTKDNKNHEGFVLTDDLTTTYISEDAERIINVVCMDSLPDYVKVGNSKVYGVITTNDIENVTATLRNERETKIYQFDKSHSEEWEIESAPDVEYQRFTCEIPVEKVDFYSVTWEAADSMGNKYTYENDEGIYIVGMQNHTQFTENTRVYSKARELMFFDPIGDPIVTVENPADYKITYYGETIYGGAPAYCYQITDIIYDKIFYGWIYEDTAKFSLSEEPTDAVHKRGIVVGAFLDDNSNGVFYQDCSNASMGYAILIYQEAGITDITTVSGPSTDDDINRKLKEVFSKCDYNDIIYITIIAHGAADLNGIAFSPLAWSLHNGNVYYSRQLNGIILDYVYQIGEVHLIIDSCFAGTYSYPVEFEQPPVIDALLATTGAEAGRFVKDEENNSLLCSAFINSLYDYMTSKFNTKATLSQLCAGTVNYEKYINAIGTTYGLQNIANLILKKGETKPTCFYGATGSEDNIFFDTTK